jgi:hypothetical protein
VASVSPTPVMNHVTDFIVPVKEVISLNVIPMLYF